MIFEKEKDEPLTNSEVFIGKILKKYKYKIKTCDLYRAIVNYQIKTYGRAIYKNESQVIEFNKYFSNKSKRCRDTKRDYDNNKCFLEKLERRR